MSFERAASLGDLWVGELAGVVVGSTRVLLVRLADGVRAFEDSCAHKGLRLSEGRLAGTTLTCAAHDWRYDVASGRGIDPAGVCLRAFAVHVVDDDVLVDVDAPAEVGAVAGAGAGAGTTGGSDPADDVGPVLQNGPIANAIVAAILAENRGARVVDRGAYLRVLCPGRCVVTRAAIEARTGSAFRLPRDLELLMSSFKGRFRVSEDEARWEAPGAAVKTYSHLAQGRHPTEYEIVTSRLHYYVERGFEVRVPVSDWYERYQGGSGWQAADWENFSDPRETTYTTYTRMQRDKEAYVDGLLGRIDASSYDRDLGPEARALLEQAVLPLRYVFHGFQMIAAYVGQMAPSGRITIAALLQGADEVRRIHRLAYRLAQLRASDPNFPLFGEDGRLRFETDPCWQPMRRLVESLLVTYDWAEAFVALNVCVKPVIDELTMVEVGALARARGDFSLGQILASLDEDCQWHRRWTAALVRVALAARPENGAACRDWIDAWMPEATEAARALGPLLGSTGDAAVETAMANAERRAAELHAALELAGSRGAP